MTIDAKGLKIALEQQQNRLNRHLIGEIYSYIGYVVTLIPVEPNKGRWWNLSCNEWAREPAVSLEECAKLGTFFTHLPNACIDPLGISLQESD